MLNLSFLVLDYLLKLFYNNLFWVQMNNIFRFLFERSKNSLFLEPKMSGFFYAFKRLEWKRNFLRKEILKKYIFAYKSSLSQYYNSSKSSTREIIFFSKNFLFTASLFYFRNKIFLSFFCYHLSFFFVKRVKQSKTNVSNWYIHRVFLWESLLLF